MAAELSPEEMRAVVDALGHLAKGECPACGLPHSRATRHGRCLYCPCGHRIGQVARPSRGES